MASKVEVLLIDDVDGSAATESVTFGLDGVTYEIDLSESNDAKLRKALAPWVDKARKVSGRRGQRAPRGTSNGTSDSAQIREWAKANGVAVPDRGRIPESVREQYAARTP